MKKKLPLLLVATIFIFYSTGNAGSVNLKKGKRVFNKCKACHTLVTAKNRVGPSLKGVFGRQAGTVAKYRYSKAMKKAGQGGLVWSEATMSKYLIKPRKFIKGTKMSFAGLRKDSDIKNLIAFLKKATQ